MTAPPSPGHLSRLRAPDGQELAAGFLYAAEMCADFVSELVQRMLDDVFQIAVATDDA
jgi:hypothetical protein